MFEDRYSKLAWHGEAANVRALQAGGEKMDKQRQVEYALVNLLEWAKGNRDSKRVNPYGVPEVKEALQILTEIWGRSDYLDVDSAPEYRALNLRDPEHGRPLKGGN